MGKLPKKYNAAFYEAQERVGKVLEPYHPRNMDQVFLDNGVIERFLVFRRDDGEPYADKGRQEGGQIKTAWATACRKAGLLDPVYDDEGNGIGARPSVTPHACRHSFSSWFYAVTKDPMLLRDEGGWASLAMVERYSHLMPSEMVPDVVLVWGDSHPRVGVLTRAPSVQSRNARSRNVG